MGARRRVGGIGSLGWLIYTQCEALEADFQRFYALDFRQATWGEEALGIRRLRALIRGLPPGSAVHRALDPHSDWTANEELLASLIEVVDLGNRWFFGANTKKGSQQPKPIKIPRPRDDEKEPRKPSTPDEIQSFMGRKRKAK